MYEFNAHFIECTFQLVHMFLSHDRMVARFFLSVHALQNALFCESKFFECTLFWAHTFLGAHFIVDAF